MGAWTIYKIDLSRKKFISNILRRIINCIYLPSDMETPPIVMQRLAQKALIELKKNSNFPVTGFIAGGSMANLIWEYSSGNKAVINDIDVFVFNKLVESKSVENDYTIDGKKLDYFKREYTYHDGYGGLGFSSKIGEFYKIDSTYNDGIYNYINYSSSNASHQIILDSFDINCTQVGYSIDEDKFYWTKDFEEFLKCGELKLTNLLSPAHSAIRLFKKREELAAKLDIVEVQLCQFCLVNHMNDINRIYFSEKYAEKYKNYSELNLYFDLKEDEYITKIVSEKIGTPKKMYRLDVINDSGSDFMGVSNKGLQEFTKTYDISGIWNSGDLIFYFRKIYNNKKYELVWKKLHYLFEKIELGIEYVDLDPTEEEIDFLYRVTQNAPRSIDNLKGMKLSEQIFIVKNLFDKYKDDPIVAVSILEKYKINKDQEFEEDDLLLMELSVRKEIKGDYGHKVSRIFKTNENNLI